MTIFHSLADIDIKYHFFLMRLIKKRSSAPPSLFLFLIMYKVQSCMNIQFPASTWNRQILKRGTLSYKGKCVWSLTWAVGLPLPLLAGICVFRVVFCCDLSLGAGVWLPFTVHHLPFCCKTHRQANTHTAVRHHTPVHYMKRTVQWDALILCLTQ